MPVIENYPTKLVLQSVVVPAGENFTAPINGFGATLTGISIPQVNFLPVGDITLGFYVSVDERKPYRLLVNDQGGSTNAITVKFNSGGNLHMNLTPITFLSNQYFKLYLYNTQAFDAEFDLVFCPALQ